MLTRSAESLMDLAIQEDLSGGDITTDNLFSGNEQTKANLVVKQPAIVSGISVAIEVFRRVDPSITCVPKVDDGDAVTPGQVLMEISGPTASILKAERLALNFIQHLSGIALLTYQYVGSVNGTRAQITHTRKTHPGLRALEMEAVLHGGGIAHRASLSQAVLIKDNHIQAAGSVEKAIVKIREKVGADVPIEVECDTLEQVKEALKTGCERILMDNMPLNILQEAVKLAKGKAIVEASGGITLKNVRAIAECGVDIISTSQITLSAPAVDAGLDFLQC